MNLFPVHPPVVPIHAATYPPLYRVVCPDGQVYDDVDTEDAAREAASYADAMHDNAICDGHHQILVVATYHELVN